jgi:hypothetical protein
MSKLMAVEVNTRESDETFFANYVYDNAHDQYEKNDEYDLVTRINCVVPNVSYESVKREAKRIAEANNVKIIDYVRLEAGVPFVETLVKLQGK